MTRLRSVRRQSEIRSNWRQAAIFMSRTSMILSHSDSLLSKTTLQQRTAMQGVFRRARARSANVKASKQRPQTAYGSKPFLRRSVLALGWAAFIMKGAGGFVQISPHYQVEFEFRARRPSARGRAGPRSLAGVIGDPCASRERVGSPKGRRRFETKTKGKLIQSKTRKRTDSSRSSWATRPISQSRYSLKAAWRSPFL